MVTVSNHLLCYNPNMHYDLIIKNGMLVTLTETFKADIAVKDEKIAITGSLSSTDTAGEIFDAAGLHILPGIIDAHVHFRDPGLTQKEDFQTGSAAAACGGITMIADMPNTIPVTSTTEHLNEKIRIAREKSYIDFALFALLNNDNIHEIEGLQKAGALGFKIFLGTSTGDIASPSFSALLEQIQKCAKANIRIGFHAETSGLNTYFTDLCKKKSNAPDGLLLSDARPVISETLAISNALCFAQYTCAKIHIHHVTTLDGVRLIVQARQNGVKVTAETCPHYLLFDAEQSTHKVYPPIRGSEHRKGLWEALEKESINMLASDHAPHTADEKALSLWDAPAGLSGVETFVPLMLTQVNKGVLSLNNFVRLASEAPAKIWGIYPKKGNLLAGADADFTIVDMNKKSIIDKNKLHSKSKTSPYHGMEVQGLPIATLVRGKFVMKEGSLTGEKGFGSFISPVL